MISVKKYDSRCESARGCQE